MKADTIVPIACVVLPKTSTSSLDQTTSYIRPAVPEATKMAKTSWFAGCCQPYSGSLVLKGTLTALSKEPPLPGLLEHRRIAADRAEGHQWARLERVLGGIDGRPRSASMAAKTRPRSPSAASTIGLT